MSWLGDQAFRPLMGRDGEGLLPVNLMRVEVDPPISQGMEMLFYAVNGQYHINYYTTK